MFIDIALVFLVLWRLFSTVNWWQWPRCWCCLFISIWSYFVKPQAAYNIFAQSSKPNMHCHSDWSFALIQVLYILRLPVIRYQQCNKYPRVINILTDHLQFIFWYVQMQDLPWVALKLFIYLGMTIRKSWHNKHPATMLTMVYCISINSRCQVLSTQVRLNRSPPLRPLMKLLCRRSKDWRKFILDYLQNPSERVNNMVRRMVLIYGTLSPDCYRS